MSTFKGQDDMLTELQKSNMVKNDIASIKKIQKRLKERLDELVKENINLIVHSFLQLTKLQERNSEFLIFEKRNYASCHRLGKHVIYLISIKLEQFVIWRVSLEP